MKSHAKVFLAVVLSLFSVAIAQPDTQAVVGMVQTIPGPFISRPDVMEALDRVSPDGDCKKSGPLVFGCLIQAQVLANAQQAVDGTKSNPFNLKVAEVIAETILRDLNGFQQSDDIDPEQQLHPQFLSHPASRIELVGIVNRIDRQFIHDIVPGAENHNRCGEISLVYRFSYSLFNGDVTSRLPVTMNVVLPAIPRTQQQGARSCADIAGRWLREMQRPKDRPVDTVLASLNDRKDGIVSLLQGKDIERIELNIQGYRISAGADNTDLGSTAEYIIRVFRWSPEQKRYTVSYLTNQIDRARILGNAKGDVNSCNPGSARPIAKRKFIDYLSNPAVLSDVDTGTLNIPLEYLACRATSVSPGGAHRSRNLPFWNANAASEQIITDSELGQALSKAKAGGRRFSFINSTDDLRTRLNDMTCSGCHQARAIAGFHFPGADRPGTASSNAVLLPGSPQFYGDQPRRQLILERLVNGDKLSRFDLATGYSARPHERFADALKNTALIGGWGSACLLPNEPVASKRNWTCNAGLTCAALIKSNNAPGLGICIPEGERQVGDPLQTGEIKSSRFGVDRYVRATPVPVGDWSDKLHRDTRIPATMLPAKAPANNSYNGSHQEFYKGIPLDADSRCQQTDDRKQCFHNRRDALTGGFPGGMLELSECVGLPAQATCGLIASSGFNACLSQVGNNTKTLAQCFEQRTSYAGMRACDASSPCRDDYICLQPIGYNSANGHDKFTTRKKITSANYADEDFGQQEPDAGWLNRNNGNGDQRGICIPPYFVFQFRSDGHPSPLTMKRISTK